MESVCGVEDGEQRAAASKRGHFEGRLETRTFAGSDADLVKVHLDVVEERR